MTKQNNPHVPEEIQRQISETSVRINAFFVSSVKEIKGFPYRITVVDAGIAKLYAENLAKGEEYPDPEKLIIFYLEQDLYTISLAKALSKYSVNQFYLQNNGWRERT